MKTILKLLVLLVLLGGWALAAASVHLVRYPGNIPYVGNVTVVTRQHLGYRGIYADTRQWTLDDVGRNAAVSARLLATGQQAALAHLGSPDVLARAIEQGPAKAAEPATQPAVSGVPPTIPAAGAVAHAPAPARAAAPPAHTAAPPGPTQPEKPSIFDFK